MTVTERPIHFSTPMIIALLNGTKTQTRRIVKGAWHEESGYLQSEPEGDEDGEWCFSCKGLPASFITRCPHGRVKDHLWVKETFALSGNGPYYKTDSDGTVHHAWTSSRFMPRKFSRITLEITGVRVERLQDITEADAKAEGVTQPKLTTWAWDSRLDFMTLWDSINSKRQGCSWADNPFCWRISFRTQVRGIRIAEDRSACQRTEI